MKLHSLTLENYRRHRRTEIEFPSGITAILGGNGAGKSTILEAIAFALYGPKAVRTRKDLLRYEAAAPGDSVVATLEFELANQAIRIRRELRGRSQTPHASVEVDGALVVQPNAGSSERATQLVEKWLGLDREAFFHTLVTQQGELDRLNRMTGAERRAFILDMMGVDALDRAIALARERRKGAQDLQAALKATAPDPATLQEKLRVAQESAAQTAAHEAAASAHALAAQTTLEKARAEAAAAQEAAQVRQATELQAMAAQRELETAQANEATAQRALQEARAAVAAVQALGPHAASWPTLQQRLNELDLQAQAAEQHRRALATLQAAEQECSVLQARLAAWPLALTSQAIEPIEADLAQVQSELAAAVAVAQRHEHEAARLQVAKARFDGLGGQALCPTCDQPLAGHREKALAELESSLAEALAAKASSQIGVESLRRSQREAAARLTGARQANEAGQREALLRQQATGRAQALRENADKLRQALPSAPPAPEERAPLAKETAAARQAHEQILRLQAVATSEPARAASVLQATTSVQLRLVAVEEVRSRLAQMPDARARHQGALVSLRQAEASVRLAQAAAEQARLAASHAHRDVVEAEARLAEARLVATQVADLGEQARLWTAVAGPQSEGLLDQFKLHVVARIGPAIAQEASRLLEMFTQGRYSEVRFDEAYDVWVTDGGVGYELERFSGGERDMVHLAIRLGISRLLASRSGGAGLRFLALDEVFASLDREHRELVLAALHSITSLYDQVLAITHTDALQEALDNAIQVQLVDGEAVVSRHNG